MSERRVSVLDIKEVVENIQNSGDSLLSSRLNDFLKTIPEKSNYLIENRFGLTGFFSEVCEFFATPIKSSTPISKHIAIVNLSPGCYLVLSPTQYQEYQQFRRHAFPERI